MTLEDKQDLVEIFNNFAKNCVHITVDKSNSKDTRNMYRERGRAYVHAAKVVENFYTCSSAGVNAGEIV